MMDVLCVSVHNTHTFIIDFVDYATGYVSIYLKTHTHLTQGE